MIKDALTRRFGQSPDVPDAARPLLTMAARGSVRNFADRPVEMVLVETLCAVALSAPSKSDLQQRDIVVIQDPAIRGAIDRIAAFDWLPTAPVFLVFLANTARFGRMHDVAGLPLRHDGFDATFNAIVDAGVALGTCVAAAEAIGLGACPISVIRNAPEEISDLLHLPDRVMPVCGLALGWPAKDAPISPRLALDATVHRDRYTGPTHAEIHEYDQRRGWLGRQRDSVRFGTIENYGWSDDKARQYADAQREGWGEFLRQRGFSFD